MANKYWVPGGNGNWSSTTNWSTSSGGSGGTAIPTTSDTAIFDSNSGSGTVTVDTSTAVTLHLTATGFTGTFYIASGNKLTVRSNFTLDVSNVLSGGGNLDLGYSSTTGTWNFADLAIPWVFTSVGTGAKTFNSNVTFNNTVGMTSSCYWYGSSYLVTCNAGWGIHTSYYMANNANTVQVKITGGTIYGYLPSSQNGCTLEPSTSDIIFTPGTDSQYFVYLRDSTNLIINSSTHSIITDSSEVYAVSWNGQFTDNTGGVFKFDRIRLVSGTLTLNSDMYMKVLNEISGNPTVNGNYKIHILEQFNLYGTSNIQGTATLSLEGTMNAFTPVSYQGTSNTGATTIGINIEFNAPGETITIYPRAITFNGSAIISYVAGTIVTTGFTPSINGTVTFNWLNGHFSTLSFVSNTDTLTNLDDFSVDSLNMYSGTQISTLQGKTFTVNNSINGCANELYQNKISSISYAQDIMGNNPIQLHLATERNDGVIPSTGYSQKFYANSGYGLTASNIALGTDFTIAFTFFGTPSSATGSTYLFYGGSTANQIYISYGTKNMVVYAGGSWSYSPSLSTLNWSVPHRFVITKAQTDANIKLYVDGVLKTGTYTNGTGTSMNSTLNQIGITNNITDIQIDQALFFNVVKDQTWVTNDYNGGVGKAYTSGETGLVAGYDFDDTNIYGFLNYQGANANIQIAKTDFYRVNACASSVPVYSWYGSAYDCYNAYAITSDNIGGQTPTTAEVRIF